MRFNLGTATATATTRSYSRPVANENYLRGVQLTDSRGMATCMAIFSGFYSGRMPHIHFEVYRSEITTTSYSNKLKTSRLALPTDICSTVYDSASGYAASIANVAQISSTTDNVFSDGIAAQLATVSGSLSDGYLASLVVGISI
jgi:protocatechuate 3,4-dioxygenase beta subunit